MKNEFDRVIHQFQLKNGLDVDVDEGYPKIISSQFGGDPGKGFKELIQNAIDSYPAEVPMEKRKGEIESGLQMIRITDFGTGLTLDKLQLLLTLGGTDKHNDASKIGRFGIGFFSIFNPKLTARKVIVTTNCEGNPVELTFTIHEPGKKPHINIRCLKKETSFSTRIEVHFNNLLSVKKCLDQAERSLRYYPWQATVNGRLYPSVWNEARNRGNRVYSNDMASGFLETGSWLDNVTLLCRYEYIMTTSMCSFPVGGHHVYNDLRDYEMKKMPYVPGCGALINNDSLTLTISRDGYYLDSWSERSVDLLRAMLLDCVVDKAERFPENKLIQANQFIFNGDIKKYLADPGHYAEKDESLKAMVVYLAKAKAYRLCDRVGLFSLADLKKMLSPGLPLFYSEHKSNLRWLGGEFRHDFIVLPDPVKPAGGSPDMYARIMAAVTDDLVDLDSIQNNTKKIGELVERKIVRKSALMPICRFVGEKRLNREQAELLLEINAILMSPAVKEAISSGIRIPVRNIHATFFEVQEEGAYISTGLFNPSGEPLEEGFVSNFQMQDDQERMKKAPGGADVLLGLRLDNPFISFLLDSRNRHKAFYTLTYVAHELALCQKLLVPFSPFYHLVKEKTATAMRKALISHMLQDDTTWPGQQ